MTQETRPGRFVDYQRVARLVSQEADAHSFNFRSREMSTIKNRSTESSTPTATSIGKNQKTPNTIIWNDHV
jgi:hypothetical protein